MKKSILCKTLAAGCILSFLILNVKVSDASSGTTSCDIPGGKLYTTVTVESTGSLLSLWNGKPFAASATSLIFTNNSIKNHTMSLTLKYTGLQGSLSCSIPSGSVGISCTQTTNTMATYSYNAGNSSDAGIFTYNNRVTFPTLSYVVPVPLLPKYYTIKGEAMTQATIKGYCYVNNSYCVQYY